MEEPTQRLYGAIISIIILTIINAFLAGAEMAFVSLNRKKIHEQAENGDKKAKKVLKLLGNSDEFLSAIQVGITFAGFLNSASASQAFVGRLTPYLQNVPGGQTIATIIVTIVLSYITLVLGELYPKQLALQIPETYARISAGPILWLKRIFKPFIWLLTISTGLVKKITPIQFSQKEEKLTRDEVKAILKSGRIDGVIDINEFNMMRGVLALDTKMVREIMVPRVDAFMIDIDDDINDIIQQIVEQGYSRIPVYKEDKDHVQGILTFKDVLIHQKELLNGSKQLTDLLRPALFVPESIFIDDLLFKFKDTKQLIAIIGDGYGGVSGIVTLEDLVEEIVGDIDDEYDKPSEELQVIDHRTLLVKANMPIDTFNTYFNTTIESKAFDTIAGFMLEQLGHIPKPENKERIQVDQYDLIVEEVKKNRIDTIKVVIHEDRNDGHRTSDGT